MSLEETVSEILETYDLSRRRREKIAEISVRRLNQSAVFDFDSVYEYVAYLVDTFMRLPVVQLSENLRLKQTPVYNQMIIGPDVLFDDAQYMTLNEALSFLENELDHLDMQILRQLLHPVEDCGDIRVEINPDYLRENLVQVQKRIKQVATILDDKGRVVIPKRPVKEIKFDPFVIRFGKRDFKGNPLKVIQDHPEIFGRMSSKDLYRFDPGLYHSLLRHGQLKQANLVRRHFDYGNDPLPFIGIYQN